MTTPTITVPVAANSTLRRGVSRSGPDNTLAVLPAGDYPALVQCAGEEVDITTAKNFWWVKITANGQTGWVSAVEILVGDSDQAIPGVPEEPTTNE